MSNSEEFGYFAKIVSERLGVATDTLRSWALKLEALGVTFERNERNQRIYYEKNIRALKNMKELLDLQQPLDDVAKIITEKIEKGVFDGFEKENNASETLSVIDENNTLITLEDIKKMMREVAAAAADERFQTFQIQQQRALPSPEEIRIKKFDEMMLNRRIERRLQESAEKEWGKLPEEERIIKMGLFGLKRIENAEKKIRFITDYVNKHYENELKSELDIEEEG